MSYIMSYNEHIMSYPISNNDGKLIIIIHEKF